METLLIIFKMGFFVILIDIILQLIGHDLGIWEISIINFFVIYVFHAGFKSGKKASSKRNEEREGQ